MLVGDRQVLQLRLGRDMGSPDFRQQGLRPRIHRAPVDQLQGGARRVAEKDVFRRRQLVEENRFLMDGGDAGLEGGMRRGKRDRLARDADLALVRLVDAGHGLDQCRLARAVFADQGCHFAGIEAQRHLVQRAHAGKDLEMPDSSILGSFWLVIGPCPVCS